MTIPKKIIIPKENLSLITSLWNRCYFASYAPAYRIEKEDKEAYGDEMALACRFG